MITPLPGIGIEREQLTTNVQSATAREIDSSRAVNVTDFMNTNLQSVNVNDYAGNPYQQDLNFRGFSASPLIGTPQGVSVYFDGVRVNEPFGEVVNWDFLPTNAIRSLDLMPGSNPLFGLNTLGGALALTTKSGFTDQRFDTRVLTGSFGRRQVQASVGANNGTIAGFLAANNFEERGWRDRSPSKVRQIFGRADLRLPRGQLGLSMLAADNALTGNGVVPVELYDERRQNVFTAPDQTENRLFQVMANGRADLTDTFSLSAMGYARNVRQNSAGGDFYDEWDQAANGRTGPCPDTTNSTFPDGAVEIDATGCPGVTPNGVFNFGRTNQVGKGAMLQLNYTRDRFNAVFGMAHDTNHLGFGQRQRLGWIGTDREVFLDPATFSSVGLVPLVTDIQRNNLSGSSQTNSLFAMATLSATKTLHFTLGGRWSRSRVRNQLEADRPLPLYQFSSTTFNKFEPRCGAGTDPRARLFCTSGDYRYYSFNPSAGVSWLPTPTLNFYGNVSRGSRVPSAIELGCARDREAEEDFSGQNNGKLQGCSIPTALTNDPFLPQVRSTSIEAGSRGQLFEGRLLWNVALYRTDLTNDILFVSLGKRNRGVFDTFGKTRRQGVEIGLSGVLGSHTFRAAYSRVDATFESTARVVNPSNSSSSRVPGQVNEFEISPGDRIPGIPKNILRLAWNVDLTERWSLGANMIAHSWSYSRGNENNDHQPGGTDTDGRAVTARNDPTITTYPGRQYEASGRVPGYAIVSLNTSYRLNDGFALFMRVDNVFNRRFETAGEMGLNPFSQSRYGVRDATGFNYNSLDWTHSQFVGPGAPRAIWFGFTYSVPLARGGSES